MVISLNLLPFKHHIQFWEKKEITQNYRIYSRNSSTFLTKILYLNSGCVIYARKQFYVNKSGYTGNFFKYCIKSVNYAMAWITRVNTVNLMSSEVWNDNYFAFSKNSHTQTKQNKQVQWWRNHPLATRHMFRPSSKMQPGDPRYISDMLSNSWTVIILFLRTNSLTQTTLSLIFLWWQMSWAFGTWQHRGNTPFRLRKTLKNLNIHRSVHH